MSEISKKAKRIIERRRELLKLTECLQRMLDVFEASDNIDLLIWQVSLVRDPSKGNVKCCVAFGTETVCIHYDRKDLLTDEYVRLEESHPIILAMDKVDNIVDEKIMINVYHYLEKNPLENFNIEYKDNRFTIKMNEKAICEKEGIGRIRFLPERANMQTDVEIPKPERLAEEPEDANESVIAEATMQTNLEIPKAESLVEEPEDANESVIAEVTMQTDVEIPKPERLAEEPEDDDESVMTGANMQNNGVIPKPERLIGGTEVYQKEGLPYWFCKIKNGRDEFMHLYTNDLTATDLLDDPKTGKPRKFTTKKGKEFRKNVLSVLTNKPIAGYTWIPVCEPSSDGNGGIQFVEGKSPLLRLEYPEWQKLMKEYSPENESTMASSDTYFLIALRWLKDEVATLEQLTIDSIELGNYSKIPIKSKGYYGLHMTGETEFGGLKGLVGNTRKLVKDYISESGFALAGGSYHDSNCIEVMSYYEPARVGGYNKKDYSEREYVGLLELRVSSKPEQLVEEPEDANELVITEVNIQTDVEKPKPEQTKDRRTNKPVMTKANMQDDDLIILPPPDISW